MLLVIDKRLVFLRYVMTVLCWYWLQDHGFNTGVILLDLARLRQINWVNICSFFAQRALAIQQYTDLAQQVGLFLTTVVFAVGL